MEFNHLIGPHTHTHGHLSYPFRWEGKIPFWDISIKQTNKQANRQSVSVVDEEEKIGSRGISSAGRRCFFFLSCRREATSSSFSSVVADVTTVFYPLFFFFFFVAKTIGTSNDAADAAAAAALKIHTRTRVSRVRGGDGPAGSRVNRRES